MPELPEVETIRLQLNSVLKDQVIKNIEVLKSKSFQGEKEKVKGKKITGIRRFGKLLIVDLEKNEITLAIHLKMTGRLIYRGKKTPPNLNIIDEDLKKLPNKHTRVIIFFESNDILYFNDMRIFGWIKAMEKSKVTSQISKLGIEPFTPSFTEVNFKKILLSSGKPIKTILMDQEKIAGVGNIYTNESLFCARIDPRRKAISLSEKEMEELYNCTLKILKQAIKLKGASDNDYRDAFGQKGEEQNHFQVYNRKGDRCFNNCGEVIQKIKLGARGTYFCPKCQN